MLQFCVVCGLNHINLSLKAPAEGTAFGGVIYCLATKVYAVFVINFYFFQSLCLFCHKLFDFTFNLCYNLTVNIFLKGEKSFYVTR